MNCDYVNRHLDALMDGEVDASGRMAMDLHLAECLECAERLAFARAVKHHLKRSVGACAPQALRARLEQELSEDGSGVQVMGSWGATAGVAAAALLIFGLGGFVQLRGDGVVQYQAGSVPVVQDLLRVHDLPAASQVQAAEQVPEYFEGKLGFPVRPVSFQDPGVRFEGARSASVLGRRAARLSYDVGGRRLTVVAFRTPRRPLEGVHVEEVGGRRVRLVRMDRHTVPLVEHDGITYAVVGDMDPTDRLKLLDRVGL